MQHISPRQRVDGDVEGSNGTAVGALLLQGWPRQLAVSMPADTDGVSPPHNLADADLKTVQARFSPLDRL